MIAAFCDSGLRNAGTPFEIASTPVSATAPDENARSSRNDVTPREHRLPLSVKLVERRLVDVERPEVAE